MTGLLLGLSACESKRVVDSNDMICTDAPNCVSSEASSSTHYIKPFSFQDAPDTAIQRLKLALTAENRVTIIDEQPTYILAEVRSLIFRFVDDVEFTLLPEQGLIHLRSVSRVGYSDFGVNRRRIERIRVLFQK